MKKRIAALLSLTLVMVSLCPMNESLANEIEDVSSSGRMETVQESYYEPETEPETIADEIETDTETVSGSMIEDGVQETESAIDEEVLVDDSETRISGDWKYKVEGGTATIVGYTGWSSYITIPDSLGGYTVTRIGDGAFANSNMTSLTIPEKIAYIGEGAFQYCSRLSTIIFNARECNMDCYYWNENDNYSPFRKAGASASSLTVGEDYARVTNIIISDSVTEIGEGAFLNCKDLSGITWGSEIQKIGASAFANDESIKSLSLPSKVNNIGSYAFSKTGITSLTIPEKVTSIGKGAFQYCSRLTTINYNARECNMDCYYWNENDNYSNYSPFRKAGASASSLTVTFGSAVENVPDNIFRNSGEDYARVTNVVFGQNVRRVGENAFNNCKDLKQVQWNVSKDWWKQNVAILEGNDPLLRAAATYKPAAASKWYRLAGNGRYDTMQVIVKAGFSKKGRTVLVATGTGFKDALAAAGLAGLFDAPVILTDGKNISSQAKAELSRLSPSKIYVAGGAFAVSDKVLDQIKTATNKTPIRLYGQNSSETSAKLALAGKGSWSDTAIIATNKTFKDALSVAPLAYANKMPILLADNGQSVSSAVLKALKDCSIKNIIIVGGTAAVSTRVENQLTGAGFKIKDRLWGNNGVATSAAIAKYGINKLGMSADQMGVATSQNYPDALAGAAFCGVKNSVLILADDKATANTSFPTAYKNKITKGYVFGGTSAVGERTVNMLDNALK